MDFNVAENVKKFQYPNDILKKIATPIKDDESVKEVLLAMRDFVRNEENKALGLALPQVGISQRGFVATVRAMVKGKERTFTEIFINPKIIIKKTKYKQPSISSEGCLSLKDIDVTVPRAKHIVVTYEKIDGSRGHLELFFDSARVVQHELDHLDGLLITDRGIKEEKESVNAI